MPKRVGKDGPREGEVAISVMDKYEVAVPKVWWDSLDDDGKAKVMRDMEEQFRLQQGVGFRV